MKYSIIFCFVFALINSKVEFTKYKSFVQIAKNMLEYEESDEELCESHNIERTCIAQTLKNEENECCYLSGEIQYKDYDGDERSEDGFICEAVPKKVTELKEILEYKETKELVKEVYGFVLVNENDDMPEEFSGSGIIKCKNTEIKGDIDFSLTSDDKKKLKSENHCFYHIYSTMNNDRDEEYDYDDDEPYEEDDDEEIYIPPSIGDKEKCEDKLLRDDTKDAGIECGYLKVETKIENQPVSFKTCFPFNKKLLSKITNLKLVKQLKEQYLDKLELEENIHIEFYNSKGSKVTYDTNKSIFLSNNLLLLLFFILFML